MLQRNGEVVIQMLPNVQQVTIQPVMTKVIKPGSLIYTDEYNIYDRLEQWGYQHKSVNHSAGEYARDEDGDGFHEIHVNTIEGFWSLLRSWLRPHRGISQEKLPCYLALFEFIHNVRRRGKALLPCLTRYSHSSLNELRAIFFCKPAGSCIAPIIASKSDHSLSSQLRVKLSTT